jgi:hypothetical protein
LDSPAKLEATLDSYVTSAPSPQNMLDVFDGEWASRFPPPLDTLTAGSIPLFQDARIHWMFEELGGVGGLRVLELGPLEAGHSYMLDRAGAMSVLAIEANRRAFLKCLIAKEILGMPTVEFVLGDFREFLQTTAGRWDLCVASGVLYHMRDPMELLSQMAAHTDRLFLWTHYYDEAILNANPNLKPRFGACTAGQTAGFAYRLHRYNYLEAVKAKGFCGGSAHYANWLSRDAILGALKHFGFQKIATCHETPEHPHGPCFSLVATR